MPSFWFASDERGGTKQLVYFDQIVAGPDNYEWIIVCQTYGPAMGSRSDISTTTAAGKVAYFASCGRIESKVACKHGSSSQVDGCRSERVLCRSMSASHKCCGRRSRATA